MVLCQNCRKNIDQSKYFLHERYCKLNVKYCADCKEVVVIEEFDEHVLNHKSNFLSKKRSGENSKDNDDLSYKKSEVSFKVECQYCQIRLNIDIIAEHEEMCGARTINCGICNKKYLLKKLKRHLQKRHKINDDQIYRKRLDSFNKEDDNNTKSKNFEKINTGETSGDLNQLSSAEIKNMTEDEQLARALALSEKENNLPYGSQNNNKNSKSNSSENSNQTQNKEDEIDLNDVDEIYARQLYEEEMKMYEEQGEE